MLSLHYHELMGKTEEHEAKNYLMVDDYMLQIDIQKFDNIKILIDTDFDCQKISL